MKVNICTLPVLRRTFVRQLAEDDCGQACLAMLLHYAGKTESALDLLSDHQKGHLSLLSLKKSLANYGYSSQCVLMNMEYLLKLASPCILHTEDSEGNMHYQVFYGYVASRGSYDLLMADPARHFYRIKPSDLEQTWKSKSALIVEDLRPDLSYFKYPQFFTIIRSLRLPGLIWIVMPILTLVNAVFGVLLSFLLQRGYLYSDIFSSWHIILALISLLLIISLFRTIFSYLRQIILLKVNKQVRKYYFRQLVQKAEMLRHDDGTNSFEWTKQKFLEISMLQNSLSVLLSTLVSEGSIITTSLAAIFYIAPVAALILSFFLLFLIFQAIITTSSVLYTNTAIRQRSSGVEQDLVSFFKRPDISTMDIYLKERSYGSLAEKQALTLSKRYLYHESAAAVTVILILGVTSYDYYRQEVPYTTLTAAVVLSYLVASIAPKLYSAYLGFAEGLDAFTQFALRISR